MHRAGDIVLTPFPFTDLSGNKVRPALILGIQKGSEDVTVCFISSIIPKKRYKLDLPISSKEAGFQKTGLKVSSLIRVTKIATLDKVVILGKIGELDAQNMKRVQDVLKTYLSL